MLRKADKGAQLFCEIFMEQRVYADTNMAYEKKKLMHFLLECTRDFLCMQRNNCISTIAEPRIVLLQNQKDNVKFPRKNLRP